MIENIRHIIKGCLAGEEEQQKKLYYSLLPYLRGVARRYIFNSSYEKDVMQETFVKIFNNLDSVDLAKGTFKSWCAKTCANTSINFNKRLGYLSRFESEIELDAISNIIPVKSESLEAFSEQELILFLKKMPREYYEVFSLFVVDDFKHPEIANLLNISPDLSRKRLSRARQWINKMTTQKKIDQLIINQL